MFDLRAHPVPVPGKNALKLLFEEGFEGAEDEIRKGGGRTLSSIQCLSPAKKYKLYKNSINKSIYFVQRSLSSSTRG